MYRLPRFVWLLALLGLAIILFASTNIDDLVILVGFFADPAFRPSDVVAAPIASRGGADHLEIAGLQVELGNKERGNRALLANLIKAAEVALEEGRRRTIHPKEILAMRQSLSDLLTIVKG